MYSATISCERSSSTASVGPVMGYSSNTANTTGDGGGGSLSNIDAFMMLRGITALPGHTTSTNTTTITHTPPVELAPVTGKASHY